MNSSFMIIKHFKEIKKKIKIQILKEINFQSWWLRSYTRWDLNLPPFLSFPFLPSCPPVPHSHSTAQSRQHGASLNASADLVPSQIPSSIINETFDLTPINNISKMN